MYNQVRYDRLQHMLEAIKEIQRVESDLLNRATEPLERVRHKLVLSTLSWHKADMNINMARQLSAATEKARAYMPGMTRAYKREVAAAKVRATVYRNTGVLLSVPTLLDLKI